MPLIVCPDCSRQVSDAAPSCLGCGRPFVAPHAPVGTMSSQVMVQRKGGVYEAAGTATIIGGMAVATFGFIGGSSAVGTLGLVVCAVGFVVFMVGRFM